MHILSTIAFAALLIALIWGGALMIARRRSRILAALRGGHGPSQSATPSWSQITLMFAAWIGLAIVAVLIEGPVG